MRRALLAPACLFWVALGTPRASLAADVTFAGSGALDYRAFTPAGTESPSSIGINSMVLELSHKTVVEVSQRLGVTVKLCFGCHGIEVDQGYGELHLSDWLNLRVGRFNVPMGEF